MKNLAIVFSILTFLTCIFFALYTDHRWEDWYITFRASKNLAIGNGLVFYPGQVLMTYTSPLGTLIPSLLKAIFLRQPDDYVLWGYRIICALVLSVTPVFLWRAFSLARVGIEIISGTLFLFLFNFLIIDNTINGMESAFMVFFMAYLIYALLAGPRGFVPRLVFAMAGLMYTRPDGFVYGGAILAGTFAFNRSINGLTRGKFAKEIIVAGGLAFLAFLPWVIVTWYYYGTPVPHTIVAKARPVDLRQCWNYFSHFGGQADLFLPSYPKFGGWSYFYLIAQLISLVSSLYWLNFKGSSFARGISAATFVLLGYLNCVSGQGAMPWYLPSVILPSIVVIAMAFQDAINRTKRSRSQVWRYGVYAAGLSVVLFSMVIFYLGSIEIRYQQRIVEWGGREKIGAFLKENKKQGDTVFMECLGYIGFYSEMKTLDFPGMSSPEVVAARKALQSNRFADIINYLRPVWLVLRPDEEATVRGDNPALLKDTYSPVRVFDETQEIDRSPVIFGKPYLLFDAKFTVYKLLRKG